MRRGAGLVAPGLKPAAYDVSTTPKPAPKAVPKAAPKAAPKTAPKAAPKAALKPASSPKPKLDGQGHLVPNVSKPRNYEGSVPKDPTLSTIVNGLEHIFIFGTTMSGKTHLARYLCRLTQREIHLFTLDTNRTWDSITCTKHHDFAELAPLYEQATPEHPTIIVFDDFNDRIQPTDSTYKELFTSGRHRGIRIITLAHTFAANGKTARSNCGLGILMASSVDATTATEFAGLYSYDKRQLMETAANAIQSEYAAIILRKPARLLGVLTAPKQYNIAQELARIEKPKSIIQDVEVELPPDAGILHAPAYIGLGQNQGGTVSPTVNMGSKQAHNMLDQSVNNFTTNMKASSSQLIQNTVDAHQVNIMKISQKHDEQEEELKYACLDSILRNSAGTFHENSELLRHLNYFMMKYGAKRPYEYARINKARKDFVLAYFPENYLAVTDITYEDKTNTAVKMLTSNNNAELLQEGITVGKLVKDGLATWWNTQRLT